MTTPFNAPPRGGWQGQQQPGAPVAPPQQINFEPPTFPQTDVQGVLDQMPVMAAPIGTEVFTPPKKGWKTSQFALSIVGVIALGALAYFGIISIEQARDFAQMLGVGGIFVTGMTTVMHLLNTYVKGRNNIAQVRQAHYGQIVQAQMQQSTFEPPPLAQGFSWRKFGKVAGQAGRIAGMFGVPGAGAVGTITDAVTKVIDDKEDPVNERADLVVAQAVDEHADALQAALAQIAQMQQMMQQLARQNAWLMQQAQNQRSK